MILEPGRREYGHITLSLPADVLRTYPRICRNKHHPSRMQIAFLVPQMNVNGSFLDQQNFILPLVLVRRYRVSWNHLSGKQHEMLRPIVFRADLEDESSRINFVGLGA